MRTLRRATWVALLAAAIAAPAGADEGDEKPEEKDKPAAEAPKPAEEADDKRAARMIEDLDAAVKATKKAKPSEPDAYKPIHDALDPFEDWKHESFVKALAKVAVHSDTEVAAKAARLLGRNDFKGTAKTIWGLLTKDVRLKNRWPVHAGLVGALTQLKHPLNRVECDEFVSIWRLRPDPAIMKAIAQYFGAMKTDKRFCRLLAEEIDEPAPANPNHPNNPPASYWEARWNAWKEYVEDVKAALYAITGQKFQSTKQAKEWFEANRKEFGFDW